MRWLVRFAATLSVLAGLVLVGVFSRPTPASLMIPQAATPSRPARFPLLSVDRLPRDWKSRVFGRLETMRTPLRPDELREVLVAVERSARRFGLDPLALLAVIEVESRFDPWAVSERGAIGLMQLRLDTARDVASNLGLDWTGDEMLFEPGTNIELGAAYLRGLLDQFGDFDLAFAAYNYGPSRIEAMADRREPLPVAYADRVWHAIAAMHARRPV